MRFRVRLDDPKSEHFRVTYISAKNPDEASSKVLEQDNALVDAGNQKRPYQLTYVVKRGDDKALAQAQRKLSRGR